MSSVTTPQDQLASELSSLTAGKIQVAYDPDSRPESDPSGRGHQWQVALSVDAEAEIGISESWVDDREGDIRRQTAATVRQWASELQDLADALDGSPSVLDGPSGPSGDDSAITLPRNPWTGGR